MEGRGGENRRRERKEDDGKRRRVSNIYNAFSYSRRWYS